MFTKFNSNYVDVSSQTEIYTNRVSDMLDKIREFSKKYMNSLVFISYFTYEPKYIKTTLKTAQGINENQIYKRAILYDVSVSHFFVVSVWIGYSEFVFPTF